MRPSRFFILCCALLAFVCVKKILSSEHMGGNAKYSQQVFCGMRVGTAGESLYYLSSYIINRCAFKGDPFKYVLGISEKDLYPMESWFARKKVVDRAKYIDRDKSVLINAQNGIEYPYGDFSLYSILDLKLMIEKYKENDQKNTSQLVFNIITTTSRSKDKKSVDITQTQSNPHYNGGVFQVASNLNCVEGGQRKVDMGNYTAKAAQGELAALSTMPASMYRTHFLLHMYNSVFDSEKEGAYVGQDTHQLNLLANLGLQLYYGYLHYDSYNKVSKVIRQKSYYKNIMVGIHKDVVPIFTNIQPTGYRKMEAFLQSGTKQKITQIFTATLNMHKVLGNFGEKKSKIDICMLVEEKEADEQVPETDRAHENNYKYTIKNEYKKLAQGCLKAAYEGTLLAAIVTDMERKNIHKEDNKKQQVVLTLVGGGVFDNKKKWILHALEKSLEKYRNYPLDVTLIMYEEMQQQRYLNKLKNLVKAYNGRYIRDNEAIDIKNSYRIAATTPGRPVISVSNKKFASLFIGGIISRSNS